MTNIAYAPKPHTPTEHAAIYGLHVHIHVYIRLNGKRAHSDVSVKEESLF